MTAIAHTPGHNGLSGMTAEEEAQRAFELAVKWISGHKDLIVAGGMEDPNPGMDAIIRKFKEHAEAISLIDAMLTDNREWSWGEIADLLAKVRQP